MKKKKYKNPIPRLRNKADKLYQQVGLALNPRCECCGHPAQCIHHFFTKASSSYLRYDRANGIPICQKCHLKLHKRQDPSMIAAILNKRGQEWFDDLDRKRGTITKFTVGYLKSIIEDQEEQLLTLEIQ